MAHSKPAAAAGPPPLLTRLYGADNVVCLRELLLRLSAASREAAPLPAALVQPHDHADYSQVDSSAGRLWAFDAATGSAQAC